MKKPWNIANWRIMAAVIVPALYFLSEAFLVPDKWTQLSLLTFILEIWLLWPLAVEQKTYLGWLIVSTGTVLLFAGLSLIRPYLARHMWILLALFDITVFFFSTSVLAAWSIERICNRNVLCEDITNLMVWLQENPGYFYWAAVLLAAMISRYIVFPAALFFIGVYRIKAKVDRTSKTKLVARIFALSLRILGALLVTIFVLHPFALANHLEVEMPNNLPVPTSSLYWVIVVLLIFLGNMYFKTPSLSIGVKTILVGTAFGSLLAIFLAYPIYTWTYNQFVPGITYTGETHESWTRLCLMVSTSAALIVGPCTVLWGQPRFLWEKIAVGALGLALAGILVMVFSGLTMTGVAAQEPLYGVATSRVGYEGDYWLLKLAIAVNNVYAYTAIVSLACIGSCAVLGGLTAAVTPYGGQDSSELTGYSIRLVYDIANGAAGGSLAVASNSVAVAAVLNTLTVQVEDLFDSFGVVPILKSEWSLFFLLGQNWLIILIYQIALLVWIHWKNRGDKLSTNVIVTTYIAGTVGVLLLPTILILNESLLSKPGFLIMFFMTSFLGLELIATVRGVSVHDEQWTFGNLSSHRWSGGDVITGALGSFTLAQFTSPALTLVMIAIAMIVELGSFGAAPPGLDWLQDLLSADVSFVTVIQSVLSAAILYLFIAPSTWFRPYDLILSKWHTEIGNFVDPTETDIDSNGKPWRTWFLWLPWILGSILVALLLMSLIGRFSVNWDFPVLALGLLSCLAILLLLSMSQIRMIKWPILVFALIIAFVGCTVCVLSFGSFLPINRESIKLIAVMLFGPSFALSYRALRAYASGAQTLRFRLITFCLVIPLLIGTLRYSSREHLNILGGLVKYDANAFQPWQSFESETTVLSGKIEHRFFYDSLKRFWIGGHAGDASLLILYQDRPIPYLVEGIEAFLQDQQQEEIHFVEDQDKSLWVATNTTLGKFNVQSIYTNATTLTPTVRLQSPISDISLSASENVWIATQSEGAARYDLSDGSLTNFTSENSGISSDIIHSLYADQYGNIWLGTAEGLERFDGTDWETIRRPGLGSDVTVQAFFEDTQGTLWIGSTKGGYRVQDGEWTAFADLKDWTGDVKVSVFHEDSQGGIWIGTDQGALRFDGDKWDVMVPDMHVTAFATEDATTLWIGGRQGLVRYDIETLSSTFFNASNSGLPTDWVRDLEFGPENKLWVSTYSAEKVGGSPWWAIGLSAIVFGYLAVRTYRGYERAPWVQARRLEHQVVDEPKTLYPTVYNLLLEPEIPTDVLLYLGVDLGDAGDVNGAKATVALAALESKVDLQEALDELIKRLESDSSRKWADPLAQMFHILARALAATRLADIADLELVINPGKEVGTISLHTSKTSIQNWPRFLTADHIEAWHALARVCQTLSRYRDVEMGADRLSYLADALTSIDNAQIIAERIHTPDGIVLRAVIAQWRHIITDGIDAVSGKAELHVELLTPQIRRDAQVTISLRLENRGRSAAESISMVVHSHPAFVLLSEAEVRLSRIPPGQSETLEFKAKPSSEAEARFLCRVQWEDRTTADNQLDFADRIRLYEVETEFERIPNPYIVGRPVKTSEMFWGRRDLLQFITENLSGAVQDRTLVLYGQRRTGKTSILYRLLRGHLGDDFIPVLIDMQEISLMIHNTADFLNEIAYSISRAVQQAGITMTELNMEAFASSPVRTFNRFLDDLEDRVGDKRIVVMFDEFELIERKIESGRLEGDILNYFRSLIQHRERLLFVFTGTHRLEEMSHDYWSILFNIALYKRVSYLSAEDARDLVREPVAGSLDIDDLVVEKILRLTHGHPYFVQLVCWALVNHCNKMHRNYATINDINAVLDEILMTGEMHFAYIWQQASKLERFALAGIASTISPAQPWARPGDILTVLEQEGNHNFELTKLVKALDSLTQRGVLEMATEGSLRYRFEVEILRFWVKENKSIAALVEREP